MRRPLAMVATLLALVSIAGGVAQDATPPPVPATLDLAALTLVPSDLPEPGFGLVDQGPVPAAAETWVAEFLDRGDPAGAARAEGLGWDPAAVGWRRRYESTLAALEAGGPERFATVVRSYVTEYATPASAAASFVVLEDETGVADARDVPMRGPLGDQAELTRFGGVSQYAVLPGQASVYEELELSFRAGHLVAGVAVGDFTGRARPDPPTVERLAATLASRIDGVLAPGGGPPGAGSLGDRVLRLAGGGIAPPWDEGYLRREGETIPVFEDAPADVAYRDAAFAATSDVYYLGLGLGDTGYYLVRLFRFGDEATAEAWLRDEPGRLRRTPGRYVDLRTLPDGESFGNASVTLSLGFAGRNGVARGYRVYARVDTVVALVHLDAVPEAPLAAVQELMAAQVACLEAGSCPKSAPVPGDLRGIWAPEQAASPTAAFPAR